jgi:hypothetical protein
MFVSLSGLISFRVGPSNISIHAQSFPERPGRPHGFYIGSASYQLLSHLSSSALCCMWTLATVTGAVTQPKLVHGRFHLLLHWLLLHIRIKFLL